MIPELEPFLNSYSICEKHYNQINYFNQQLLNDSLIDSNKRRWIDTKLDDTNISKSTFNLSDDEETLLNNKLHLLGTFESTEDGSLIANQET